MAVIQYKNYIVGKARYEEFSSIEIESRDVVFKEGPICEVEHGKDYKEPYLWTETGKIAQAIEKTELVNRLAGLDKIYVKVDEKTGDMSVGSPEDYVFVGRFQKGTDVTKLRLTNGQIGLKPQTENTPA